MLVIDGYAIPYWVRVRLGERITRARVWHIRKCAFHGNLLRIRRDMYEAKYGVKL